MSHTSHKNSYTVAELVHDASFRSMVKGTASSEEVSRWTGWMEASDKNRNIARKAATEIAGFDFVSPELPDVQKEWNRLAKDTACRQRKKPSKEHPNGNTNYFLTWVFRVAAVLILGIFVGLGSYIYSSSDQKGTQVKEITEDRTIRTGSDERKTITFSNGSKITVNSNSVITYTIGRLHSQPIRVDLEGEAYFEAKGDPSQEQPVFAVHTPGGVIRDIGTEFLVNTVNNQSSVILQEGKVEISMSGQNKEDSKFSARRGEMLKFNKSAILSRETVNPTFYTSWATGYMEFEETTMKEIAGFVEKRFAVKVKVAGSKLSATTLDGAVYFRSLSELVQSVSEVAQVPVYQSKDRQTIYIGYNITKVTTNGNNR